MVTAPDFAKKQVVFVLANEGERMAVSNDNLVVKTAEGKVKLQCTCYRLFLVYVIGHCSLTTALIQKARKFSFFIALMTPGFRMYSLVGADKEGNTLLKQKQYAYGGLAVARHITHNKMSNQLTVLKQVRDKNEVTIEAIKSIKGYLLRINEAPDLHTLMAYEGLASKLYFKSHFNNVLWSGRQPRVKKDVVNTMLDMGYTLLFTFIDAILLSFGFDTYKGIMHTQFYMRKSLTCDLVEPFRPLIDKQIKKSINLKQIREEDFLIINNQYRLKWEKSAAYVRFLMTPLMENKEQIFLYVQGYYRAFMKGAPVEQYPVFSMKEGS